MVGQVKKQEDPIEPFSLTGFWRSSLAQLAIYQDRPAPTAAFLILLAVWGAGLCRMIWPELQDPHHGQICLLPDTLFRPHSSEWRRYLLHALWPLESSYARQIFISAALLLQGYAWEYEIGSARYAILFFGLHLATSVVLLHFRFVVCHMSLESTLAAMAVVMHRHNPKIHADGLDKAVRVDWPVEPRWHHWLCLSVLLLCTGDFSTALSLYGVGIAAGAVCALRDPDAWTEAWKVASARSPGIGRAVHMALFMFVILFMPLTTPGAQTSMVSAVLNGSILSPSWWSSAVPASPPLLHMALAGHLGAQALWILRILVSLAFPLLLTPFRMWTRIYAGACFILMMYAMNSGSWQYPHVGFGALLYLIWAFWTLPTVQPAVGYKMS